MAATERSKTLYYKHCQMDDVRPKLSALVAGALQSFPIAAKRMQPSPDDSGSQRLINETILERGFVFGSLVEWTSGSFQQVIELDPTSKSLQISSIPPRERQEFLDGMGYFLIHGNDVVLTKGRSIGSAAFEHHLQWFVRDHAQLIPGETHVYLNEAPQRPEAQLSGNVTAVTLTPAPVRTGKRESRVARESIAARGDVLDAILNALRKMKRLRIGDERLERLIESRNLRASIRLSYTKSRDEGGEQFLDVLANALRNADDDWGYELKVPGLGVIRGGDLALKTSVSVPHTIGNEPDLDALANEMWKWLRELKHRGELPSEE